MNWIKSAWHAIKTTFTARTVHLSVWWQGLAASWSNVNYEDIAKRAYRNATAARALRLVAQLMASVPFVVETDDEEDGMLTEHEMLKLVTRPNPRTSTGMLMDQMVAHLYCGGELFLRRNAPDTGPNAGKPTAKGASLTLISPGNFVEFIREDGTGMIQGYRFRDQFGRNTILTTEEVLHIRIYNPADEERGMPIILGAARAIEQLEAADDWNKNVAAGGGRVPGYFIPQLEGGKQLTEEQVAHAQELADERTSERRFKNLPQVLSGMFKYEDATMTMKDADFLKSNEANERKIAAVIGIPAQLVGDEKAGTLTDAGVDSEIRAAYLLTVLPLLDFVLGEINEWLSPIYGGARLAYDRDQIEALQEDVNALYDRMVKAVGGPFLTVNEARLSQGYEELPDEEYDKVRLRTTAVVTDQDRDGEAGEGQPKAWGDGARSNGRVPEVSLSAKLEHILGQPEAR